MADALPQSLWGTPPIMIHVTGSARGKPDIHWCGLMRPTGDAEADARYWELLANVMLRQVGDLCFEADLRGRTWTAIHEPFGSPWWTEPIGASVRRHLRAVR